MIKERTVAMTETVGCRMEEDDDDDVSFAEDFFSDEDFSEELVKLP